MELTARGKLLIGVLIGLGFSAFFFDDLILFLFFVGLVLAFLSELLWVAIVRAKPNKFFIFTSPSKIDEGQDDERKTIVPLGEAAGREFNFRTKVRSCVSLSCENPHIKIIPSEFENNTRGAKVRIEFRTPFSGTYSIANLQVHFLGPLRLFGAESKLDFQSRYVVYPRIYDIAEQSSKLLGKSGIGEIPTEFPGIGTEFYDMREYLPGDDFRNVNWKASARLGRLYVNEHAREVGASYYLVLEARPTSYFDRDRLASAFLQIANQLSLLGASFSVVVHDGERVQTFQDIDRPQRSLLSAMNAAMDYAEIVNTRAKLEQIPPVSSGVIRSTRDVLSKEGLAVLAEMESLGQHQMKASVENVEALKTIMEKIRDSPSEPPAILYVCELYSSLSLAPLIEASSDLERGYHADFIVVDPTMPWVVARDEEESVEIYETYLKKLEILRNSHVRYYLGDPLKVAERVFNET